MKPEYSCDDATAEKFQASVGGAEKIERAGLYDDPRLRPHRAYGLRRAGYSGASTPPAGSSATLTVPLPCRAAA